MLTYLSID
ncbi:hypothetical protein GMOD_00003802 [Pyrenophora seminiperda CCB06]|uniref:Uncharacterized protein n=1 Tax=Pyrenophora seminiperda CCB06 TaxID=1302712 RepID=A0A3M7M006_9PLEO|nr:hypothetical protein GMOD_00003802 [Pyrenophora seminiperda CCB06]